MLLALLMLVSGCTTAGVADCHGEAIRLTWAEIDALSDEAVRRILASNEQGAARGCYVANQ